MPQSLTPHPYEAEFKPAATNWHVITGPPGSGKTALITALSAYGYYTLVEGARFIAEWWRPGEQQVSVYDERFQRRVNDLAVRRESMLDPSHVIFMDRAVPDSIAYCRLHGFDETTALAHARSGLRYRRVFFLLPGPYENDAIRIESEDEAQRLSIGLHDTYQELGYDPVPVPWLPLRDRVELVLQHLGPLRRDDGAIGDTLF